MRLRRAYVKQSVTMPGGPVKLSYTYRNGSVDGPAEGSAFDATLSVKIDGIMVYQHVEAQEASAELHRLRLRSSPTPRPVAPTSCPSSTTTAAGSTDSSDDATYNSMTIDNVSVTPIQ